VSTAGSGAGVELSSVTRERVVGVSAWSLVSTVGTGAGLELPTDTREKQKVGGVVG